MSEKELTLLIIKRIFAQIIDLFVAVLTLLISFGWVLPHLNLIIASPLIKAIIVLLLVILLNFGIQYPFMLNGQTLGKGFYHLQIVSTDEDRPKISIPIIIQREILCKLMSCYFICLPVINGKLGGHEEATHTKLISLRQKRSLEKNT